jgi:hypothetical protein
MTQNAQTTIDQSSANREGGLAKKRLYIFDDKDHDLEKFRKEYEALGFSVVSVLVYDTPDVISNDLKYAGRYPFSAMRAIHSKEQLLKLLNEDPKPDAILTDGDMGKDCPIISINPANGDSKNGSGLIEAARTLLPHAVCVLQSGSFYPDGKVKKSNGFDVVSKDDDAGMVANFIHAQLNQAKGNAIV